jgi:hypothetical protein
MLPTSRYQLKRYERAFVFRTRKDIPETQETKLEFGIRGIVNGPVDRLLSVDILVELDFFEFLFTHEVMISVISSARDKRLCFGRDARPASALRFLQGGHDGRRRFGVYIQTTRSNGGFEIGYCVHS